MNRTLDTTTASEPELRTWLAELPCPVCKSTKLNPDEEHAFHILRWDALGVAVPDCSCLDTNGKTTGRALPWASVECLEVWGSLPQGQHDEECECNGSGRVPKAVGLSLIIVESQYMGCYAAVSEAIAKQVLEKWSTEAEITLAALRVVAKAAVGQ